MGKAAACPRAPHPIAAGDAVAELARGLPCAAVTKATRHGRVREGAARRASVARESVSTRRGGVGEALGGRIPLLLATSRVDEETLVAKLAVGEACAWL